MKKRIFKKILTVLLILAMLPIFSLFALAEDDVVGGMWGDLAWTLNKTTGLLTISGQGEISYSSTELLRHAFGDTIKAIDIENGVTSIGDEAFYDFSGLTSITIPDSVTSIGRSAFSECSGLTSIAIPNSVTSIGIAAFEFCGGLKSITIPDSVTSIGSDAFYGCSGLTSITISDSVASIGGLMFHGCMSLASITIPDSVTSIGGMAFYDCRSLTSITIPNSVTSIGDSAFSGCTGLEKLIYCGTEEAWNQLNKGDSWNSGVPTTVQFHDFENYVCAECGEIAAHEHVYDNEADTTCNACGWERVVDENDMTTIPKTNAPETTKTPAMETLPSLTLGCGGSLNSTYAVIALIAVLGFAFVAKKKENE